MDIIHVTDTYTNLGRLNRNGLNPVEKREDTPIQDRSRVPAPREDNRLESTASETSGLDASSDLQTAEALALSEKTAEFISQPANLDQTIRLHDMRTTRLISPRYV